MTLNIPMWTLPAIVLGVLGLCLVVGAIRYRPSGWFDTGGDVIGCLGTILLFAGGLWVVAYWLGRKAG